MENIYRSFVQELLKKELKNKNMEERLYSHDTVQVFEFKTEKEFECYDTVKFIAKLKTGKEFELKGFIYFTVWSTYTFLYADSSVWYQNIQMLLPIKNKLSVLYWDGMCKIMPCKIVLTEKYIFDKKNFKYPKSKILQNSIFVNSEIQFNLATEDIGIKITF